MEIFKDWASPSGLLIVGILYMAILANIQRLATKPLVSFESTPGDTLKLLFYPNSVVVLFVSVFGFYILYTEGIDYFNKKDELKVSWFTYVGGLIYFVALFNTFRHGLATSLIKAILCAILSIFSYIMLPTAIFITFTMFVT